MCFDTDSHPPVAPIAGGALDAERLVLTATDGNRFAAFRARAGNPAPAAILILPDVRGLHPYYEELALRFAEHGIDALAIDYFGRSAGADPRPDEFDFMPHVGRTTWQGLRADVQAGVDRLRADAAAAGVADVSLFSIGFCFGGRLSFLAPTLGQGLRGVIGVYGRPVGSHASGVPAPVELAPRMIGSGLLGIFGGADPGIPAEDVAAFERALTVAGVDHRIVTYDNAPHSFFDRKAAEYAEASAAAWSETLAFVADRTVAPA